MHAGKNPLNPRDLGFIEDKKTDLVIRDVVTAEERQAVYRLRYKVYIEEMQRGCHADHQKKIIEDHLDETGVIAAAYRGGQLVGTCRGNFSYNSAFEYRSLYDFDDFEAAYPGGVMFTTKLMVLPEYRRGPMFLELCRHMYEMGLKRRAFVMIIDCNDHLVKPFTRLGYQAYKGKVHHPDYGPVTPMVLYNYDAKHLGAIRSPYLPVLKKHIHSISIFNDSKQEQDHEL